MIKSTEFEFGSLENKRFNTLAKYCLISATAIIIYAIANISFLVNVFLSGKAALIIRTLDDLFVTIAALFAAYQLGQAAKSFRKIVNTQGNDINLLSLSSEQLRYVFGSLAVMLIALAVRFILDYPALMSWIKAY